MNKLQNQQERGRPEQKPTPTYERKRVKPPTEKDEKGSRGLGDGKKLIYAKKKRKKKRKLSPRNVN